MDKNGFMSFIQDEFEGVLDTHWNWDLLGNIIDYAMITCSGDSLIKFLMNIIPEVTYEEYLLFTT